MYGWGSARSGLGVKGNRLVPSVGEEGGHMAETPVDLSGLAEGAGSSAALYPRLSPGPGRPAQEVSSNQRARLQGAMIEVVGKQGYDALTMRGLSQLAGVSTRTIYKHFEGASACFLSTYEMAVRRAACRIIASQRDERDWQKRLHLAFSAFAREVEREPQAARLVLVEAFAAGPLALEQMRRMEATFEAMIKESFAHAPDGIVVPPLVIKGIVAGIVRIARGHLMDGREAELPGLADELLEWVLSYRHEAAAGLSQLDRRPAPALAGELTLAAAATEVNGLPACDDRALVLAAVAKLAASEGYGSLTVPRIRAAAGVSRKRFDAQFEGVEDCFLAALEQRVTQAVTDASRARRKDDTWAEGIYRSLRRLCVNISRDPVLIKLGFVEVFSAGPEGMRCREGLMAATAALFRDNAPDTERPSELAAEASVGATWGVLHHLIRCGKVQQLPRIAATASFLALAPAVGAPAAVEAIRHRQEDWVEKAGVEKIGVEQAGEVIQLAS
jgi:AcrR family transcriptional regulator